jgi:hypothetical protein
VRLECLSEISEIEKETTAAIIAEK